MRVRDSIHNDHLPASYYAVTCNDQDSFARLEGNIKVDVCVVGGGFTGVSTALRLAEKGVDVALVEQNRIGWGASGRCFGALKGGFGPAFASDGALQRLFGPNNVGTILQLAQDGLDLVKHWINSYAIECDLKWGYFEGAETERDLAHLTRWAKGTKAECESITRRDVCHYVGTESYVGGLLFPQWGQCHPLNLVRGEARVAEQLGAHVFEDARVSDIDYGDKLVVDMDYCRVTADRLVLAGNAYLGALAPVPEKYIVPVGTYMIATEPLEGLELDILPAGHAVCNVGNTSHCYGMSGGGHFLFGGPMAYNGHHPADIVGTLKPVMVKLFPQLKDVAITHHWGGYISASRQPVPQLGQLAPNVYYAQAPVEQGITASHVCGALIADAICGERTIFDIVASAKHRPFFGGKVMKNMLLALTMTMRGK